MSLAIAKVTATVKNKIRTFTQSHRVMAALVAAIHVFAPVPALSSLILRRLRSDRLERDSSALWTLLRDADYVCSSG
jgi:nitrate reductase gamma subunit